jgi:hypothetical protein
MGHHTQNLIGEVPGFAGAIASPVNDSPADVGSYVKRFANSAFSFIIDPMLYFPRSEVGKLREWPYYPEDVETADVTSNGWWDKINAALVDVASSISVNGLCSPAVVPKAFSNDYYGFTVDVGDRLVASAKCEIWQTVLVRLAELTDGRAMEIASVVSRTKAAGVYVVFVTEVPPRNEIREVDQLRAAIRFVSALAQSGIKALVGFCGSDVVLWKAAGAFACSTGKFFNLRRFTPGRFEEPSGGGGQLPYWFEESLLAHLREADVDRLLQAGLLEGSIQSNPFCKQIAEQRKASPGNSWIALGWRQWMYWFADFERRFTAGQVNVEALLLNAEKLWAMLDQTNIFMEERRNDGAWIKPWRRALGIPDPPVT